jgi:hypothetical protein
MKIARASIFVTCIFLACTIAFRSTTKADTTENMKDVADFIRANVDSTSFPVDPERYLPWLREFCFGQQGDEYRRKIGADSDPSLLASGLWVLLRDEYAVLVASHSRALTGGEVSNQSAFWRLDYATQKFLAYSLEQGLAGQQSWAFRRALAQSYLQEIRSELIRPLSSSDVEDIVQRALSNTFTPAASNAINGELQTSFQSLVKSVEAASLFASAARLQAIQSIQDIYGPDPDRSRQANQQRLSDDEERLIYAAARYDRIRELLKELSVTPDGTDQSDVSLVGDYARLRQQLNLGKTPTPRVEAKGRPSPKFVEEFFRNDRREKADDPSIANIEKIRTLFSAKSSVSLADPLEDQTDIGSYDRATRLAQTALESIAANRSKVTGDRERAQLTMLGQTYPPLSDQIEVLQTKVPWFNKIPINEVVFVRTEVARALGAHTENKKLSDVLAHETTGVDTSTATELLKELSDQLGHQN